MRKYLLKVISLLILSLGLLAGGCILVEVEENCNGESEVCQDDFDCCSGLHCDSSAHCH